MSSNVVIKVENLTKEYRLGTINHGTLYHDLQSWWARLRGKEDPNSLLTFHTDSAKPGPSHNDEHFLALNDVSFEVQQGDLVGIIGRNGAGKSTLLKILSQVTCPSSGTVKLKGRVASLLEVGTGFHPELTGRENIYLNGAILGMSKAEISRKLDEIIAFAEIEKFVDTPVKRYSSGMYVRLAFAVAAHLEPEILIVDEVLAVGDAQFQKKCLGKMEDVGKEGRTVLFVSHNMTAIRSMCNKALLLNGGAVVAHGGVSDVISRYIDGISENRSYRHWADQTAAPQNKTVILQSVSICDDSGQRLQEVYTHTPFNLEIEYRVKNEGSTVGLTLIVYDSDNNCVFSSINNHEDSWYGKPMPAGVYKTRCKIPGNFLNNGWFNITLNLFGRDFSDPLVLNDLLRIEIHDSDVLRFDYFGEWAGFVRPDLKWTTKSA